MALTGTNDDTLTDIRTALGCSICPSDTRTNQEVLDDLMGDNGCPLCAPVVADPTRCQNLCDDSGGWMAETIKLTMSGWKWTTAPFFHEDGTGVWINDVQHQGICGTKWFSENAAIGTALNSELNGTINLTPENWCDPTNPGQRYTCSRFYQKLIAVNGMTISSFQGKSGLWVSLQVELTRTTDDKWDLFIRMSPFIGWNYDVVHDPDYCTDADHYVSIAWNHPTYGYRLGTAPFTILYPQCVVDPILSGGFVNAYNWVIPSSGCYETVNFDDAEFVWTKSKINAGEVDTTHPDAPLAYKANMHPDVVSGTISSLEAEPGGGSGSTGGNAGPYIDDTLTNDDMISNATSRLGCTGCP